ncbi:hypothetical protein LTR37_019621 [Vermiconidia calcicola]|uniref:Uncharacterized protein n=1 Tax=Vermiconidia calcicola TaxID=1690605 RepID=A0ACC3MDK6_9PEZI|nr:hypothetical protein LTR37_019621 [Vermiconidia calcicola]
MDRTPLYRPPERLVNHQSQASSPATYPQPFPPPASQPPLQIPHSDPFQTNRDPFFPGSQKRRGSFGLQGRAWPPTQGNGLTNGHHQSTPPPPQSQPLPPPPPTNGVAQMPPPYDTSRRRSISGPGSPPQHAHGPLEPHPPPPPFQSRQMPPPSPPRGPPTATPFAGVRDLASFSSYRPTSGMSISSILGGSEDRIPHSSPNAPPAALLTPKTMPPPSPGRVRASSMREGSARGLRDVSPPRNIFGEPHPMSAAFGHDRTASECRKDGMFGSPQFQHGFRAFQPAQHEQRPGPNGHATPGRPNSQPVDTVPPRSIEDIIRRDAPPEGRFTTFRHFAEPQIPASRSETTFRHEGAPFANGHGPTSQPTERGMFSSPHVDRERSQPGLMRFQPGTFGTPMREEQTGLFRPTYQPGAEPARESVETRQSHELRREPPRSTPPAPENGAFERAWGGFIDRPMTLEEHQRLEAMQREQYRKESDGSTHRALLNISPELNRKGRNSPLPQAVQGAQPRHIGPGGDNPGIKMEFGRMFSGLGSGVGTATPTAAQSMNGLMTPSRLSPARHVDGGDLVRTAVAEIEEDRGHRKASARGGKKNGRRILEEDGRANGSGRETPDQQRGAKRAKTNHAHHHHHHVHPHHHHHHHHEQMDNGPSPFNMLRFPSNPLSQSNLVMTPSHHHHHHHGAHAHPGHHHHHPPRAVPAPRKPTISVMSRRLVEECAKKPRKHLGSQLYTTEISMPPVADIPLDAKVKFSHKMRPIPFLEGKENCTYTVRVPRRYFAAGHKEGEADASPFQEICKRRQLWGTDVYTDDSDVVAAAVHSGWLKGDFGEYNAALRDLCNNESEQDEPPDEDETTTPDTLAIRPRKPVKVPPDLDAHITLLILPPLESYVSTNQHHIWSREWPRGHDGMSFMIHRIEFVDEGATTRNAGRGALARKQRIAVEEARRREAAAGLVMFANSGGSVRVGA